MALSRLKTSRARLLAILMAVMVPIAALMVAAAWTNYRFTSASVERDYTLLTSNYASRLRVWLRGAERQLANAVAAIGSLAQTNEACSKAATNIVQSIAGYRAILLEIDGGVSCTASREERTQASLAALAHQAKTGIPYRASGERIADTRVFFASVPASDVAIHVQMEAKAGRPAASAMLVVDPRVLTSTMEFGDSYPGATIAAVLRDNRIIAAHGAFAHSHSWRSNDTLSDTPRRWQATGLDGTRRVYASHPVIEGGLYILGGFNAAEINRAWYQFLALLGLPLLVLAALTTAFLRATDTYLVDWLKRLERTARARSEMREARVEISDRMPSEVRSFARAFNDMADAEASRRAALEKALEENQFLVRELHHRVKNSLQVIQSYLAIERREKTGEPRMVLQDAELRVQMLSLAYRTALAGGTIDAVNLNEFLPRLLHMIANQVLGKEQTVVFEPPRSNATLELEKVIALAFLLANVIAGAAASAPQFLLQLRLDAAENGIALTIDADRPLTLPAEPRINRGLLLQLGAHVMPQPGPNRLSGWRWAESSGPTQRFTP